MSKESTKKIINVYTDGSALGNGKRGGRAGIGVYFGEMDKRNVSERLEGKEQTNNRGELTAIKRALQILSKDSSKDCAINIYTDSQYSIKALTVWIHKWKANGFKTSTKKDVKNRDLLEEINALIPLFSNLKLHYIKAHTNHTDVHSIGNKNADELANKGALLD